MGLTELKKELKKLDKEKLVELIADLYKKNKSAKELLDFFVNPNEHELFLKYKDKVYEAFFPKRGDRFSLSDGKKAISDFKKLEASKELLAELMLFYVETGVEFTNEFGDIDEPFYNSIESVYSNALTLMAKENILDKFGDRAKKIVDDTTEIGWGFHDELGNIYNDFYR
ncbi:MAG TPA: DUF6155 family protein [Edaphocola sp.]|nr:DUF6155 family protein [Edaphocola sp.]